MAKLSQKELISGFIHGKSLKLPFLCCASSMEDIEVLVQGAERRLEMALGVKGAVED